MSVAELEHEAIPRVARRRMSRRRLLAGLGVIAVAGAALAVRAAGAGGSEAAGGVDAPARTGATATVERRNLVDRAEITGTLGYDDDRRLAAMGGGVVTGIADEGDVVGRGEMLYELNGVPVFLLYGARPAWRGFQAGMSDGPDVRQLEGNLRALGYGDSLSVDEEFTAATTAAIREWQEDRGLADTGRLDLGGVVFLPGARRIGAHAATLGAQVGPGTEVMRTSSTRRIVSTSIDAADRGLAKKGSRVGIRLPSGETTRGTVTSVGTAVTAPAEQGGGSTVEVLIAVDDPKVVRAFDAAPVDVLIAIDVRKDALAVPVAALLARAEGGYALEVVGADGTTRLVSVEPGMYADGWVEVSGSGIVEGAKVVVPR